MGSLVKDFFGKSKAFPNVIYYSIYLAGLIYTGAIITGNLRAYLNYSSTFSQRHIVNPLSNVSFFPIKSPIKFSRNMSAFQI